MVLIVQKGRQSLRFGSYSKDRERFGVVPKGRDVIDLALARTPKEEFVKCGWVNGNDFKGNCRGCWWKTLG